MGRAHVFAASLALAAACGAGSCYSPSLENCVQACSADGSCPDGQHCDRGLCTSSSRACESVEASGGSAGAGTGASSATGAQSSTGGASSGSGGISTPGGAAGASSCDDPSCATPPSCAGIGPCLGNVSCCESIALEGGHFNLGRSLSGRDAYPEAYGSDDIPENVAFVSPFRLDRFEVTVRRFRRFVDSYDGTPPVEGSGENPHIPGTGWSSEWNSELPDSQEELLFRLACDPNLQTYTPASGANEKNPIVCVDWYVAFAFCVWDGGRLPTEAEWEFAASGGEDRLFPWETSDTDASRAWYQALGTIKVGSRPAGRGRFGHDDLAGNAFEYTFDRIGGAYATRSADSSLQDADWANVVGSTPRVIRGGCFASGVDQVRAAFRTAEWPTRYTGIRCARNAL